LLLLSPVFLFIGPSSPDIFTLSLHDALPISRLCRVSRGIALAPYLLRSGVPDLLGGCALCRNRRRVRVCLRALRYGALVLRKQRDRKSTRLNSSHVSISYAVFCLKKKKTL